MPKNGKRKGRSKDKGGDVRALAAAGRSILDDLGRFTAKQPESWVSKGSMLRRMDGLAADPAVMRAALSALERDAGTPVLELGLRHGYVADGEDEVRHVRDDWFDTERGWFRGHGPVEPVLRAGFIEAARRALECDPPLPVDCYWISSHCRIEVAVMRSARQVTMVLLTPPPQRGPYAPGPLVEEEIWLVRAAAEPSPVPGIEVRRVRTTE